MEAKFSDLKGKTLIIIDGLVKGSDFVTFYTKEENIYEMYHDQECFEKVEVEDICGDIQDLLDSPILLAEESTSRENPKGTEMEWQDDSFTWTFYKLSTFKGDVTIRWYGESNGYYSERVDFIEVDNN